MNRSSNKKNSIIFKKAVIFLSPLFFFLSSCIALLQLQPQIDTMVITNQYQKALDVLEKKN
ncbi:MAG: hypothetical protein ABIG64_09615 [Candidatus Omnitrophota bacterium]